MSDAEVKLGALLAVGDNAYFGFAPLFEGSEAKVAFMSTSWFPQRAVHETIVTIVPIAQAEVILRCLSATVERSRRYGGGTDGGKLVAMNEVIEDLVLSEKAEDAAISADKGDRFAI